MKNGQSLKSPLCSTHKLSLSRRSLRPSSLLSPSFPLGKWLPSPTLSSLLSLLLPLYLLVDPLHSPFLSLPLAFFLFNPILDPPSSLALLSTLVKETFPSKRVCSSSGISALILLFFYSVRFCVQIFSVFCYGCSVAYSAFPTVMDINQIREILPHRWVSVFVVSCIWVSLWLFFAVLCLVDVKREESRRKEK